MGAFEYEGKEVPVVNTCRIKHNEKWKYANSQGQSGGIFDIIFKDLGTFNWLPKNFHKGF